MRWFSFSSSSSFCNENYDGKWNFCMVCFHYSRVTQLKTIIIVVFLWQAKIGIIQLPFIYYFFNFLKWNLIWVCNEFLQTRLNILGMLLDWIFGVVKEIILYKYIRHTTEFKTFIRTFHIHNMFQPDNKLFYRLRFSKT